jgi:acetyl esterase/lipase
MQLFRRLYRKYEIAVKLTGALVFIVVVASLYFFVLSGLNADNASAGSNPQSSTLQPGGSATSTSATASPTLPALPSASPTPPLLPPIYRVAVHANINYNGLDLQNENLDLCTPLGATGLRPGVILIHDIGAAIEDKSAYASLCSVLASQGFVAAAINFRMYPRVWPAQLEDAQLAVRWLRAKAGQYNLDPSRLCAWGDSAGAYLSVFLGSLATNYPGDEANLLSNQSPQVSCVVDDFGFVDLTTLPNTAFWQSAFGFLFGQNASGQPLVTPSTLHSASPIFSVNAQSAPTYILHGTLDTTVPLTQSQELQRALQQAQVPVSYHTYPGGHSFSELSPQQLNTIKRQIISYLMAQEHP